MPASPHKGNGRSQNGSRLKSKWLTVCDLHAAPVHFSIKFQNTCKMLGVWDVRVGVKSLGFRVQVLFKKNSNII